MTLPVRVRRRAELDIDEAYSWYEARADGVGDALLRAVEACFARIERHPESHVVAYGRVRRARLHRFPYGVYYTIRADFIDVLAVYHGRRRPRRFDL
ncbi:MAG: type II toxin-antitoxin system RelE/ParE family toxin [Myxococcota bacterium]|nr:type II toxin-antitoxin system RelE/ParE family toxin [Myxococcota bacterium]